ncbi:MAG TPA: TetR/AcrR family transcriptional regulator [Micromonosporaceae bacterium]|jgi:AcrR family transcriptional regulator
MTSEVRRVPAGAAVLRGDVTDAIQSALVEELAAVGYGRLSIEAVARRAGVGKTAVYRRWDSKLAMVLEVVSAVASPGLALPDMGSLVADLEALLRFAGRALRHPLASQIIPDLLAEAARNEQIATTLHETLAGYEHAIGVLLVERAVSRGELAGDVPADLAVDLVIGPLYWRLAIARSKLPDKQIKTMAAACAAALAAAAGAR